MGSLPNFLIAGAPKCGTTSLYNDLRRHPDVYVSEPKETWFFCNKKRYQKGVDWYSSTFFDEWKGQSRVGEATPLYMAHPSAPYRISECLPEVKIIFIVRDPVERLFSHYWFLVGQGIISPKVSFSKYIRNDEERRSEKGKCVIDNIKIGMYASQINRYEKYFDTSMIKVIMFSQYKSKRKSVIKRTMEFLGIEPMDVGGANRKNSTPYPANRKVFTWMKRAWKYLSDLPGPLDELLGPVRDRVRYSLLNAEHDRPAMDHSDRAYLSNIYEHSNAALASYLDRGVSHWT